MYSSDGRYATCATTLSARPKPSTTRNSQCRRAASRRRVRASSPNQRSRRSRRRLAGSGTAAVYEAARAPKRRSGTPPGTRTLNPRIKSPLGGCKSRRRQVFRPATKGALTRGETRLHDGTARTFCGPERVGAAGVGPRRLHCLGGHEWVVWPTPRRGFSIGRRALVGGAADLVGSVGVPVAATVL